MKKKIHTINSSFTYYEIEWINNKYHDVQMEKICLRDIIAAKLRSMPNRSCSGRKVFVYTFSRITHNSISNELLFQFFEWKK